MKAVSLIALGLSLVGALVAAGAYQRARSVEVDPLKARIARLETELAQSRDRLARLEGAPQPKGESWHDHPAPPASTELADLKKRIETLERQATPGRGPIPERGANVRPNPALVEMQKKRLMDPNQPERSRAAALGLLRSQGANKTDDIVDAGLALLAQATDPNLRALILRNLRGAENARVTPPVIGILKLDADEDVRDEAARIVGEYAAQPEAKAALEQAASSDASDKVKRQAAAALASPPKNK